jgi:predicted transcriptional regulator
MRDTGRPVVLTISARTEIAVQDAVSHQKPPDNLDELETIEGIKRGLADLAAGRVTSVENFEKGFRKKHGIPRRSRRLGGGRR